MSSPWSKGVAEPVQTVSLADIMSEQYAHKLHDKELKRHEQQQQQLQTKPAATSLWQSEPEASPSLTSNSNVASTSKSAQPDDAAEWEDYSKLLQVDKEENPNSLPADVLALIQDEDESDAVIAQMLQSQFDHEYNEELRRIERQQNKQSKITVTLNKFLRDAEAEFLHDTAADSEEEDEGERLKRDWDRFETNEKMLDAIPKCGFKLDKEGEMITKHDPQLCGVRNAQRVMSFPPEFPTGDAACFDMKLSNKVGIDVIFIPMSDLVYLLSRSSINSRHIHDVDAPIARRRWPQLKWV